MEHTGHHLDVSVIGVGYAVATPVCVFLVLLRGVHAPIVRRPVIPPGPELSAAGALALAPLAAEAIGLVPVVATIAGICAVPVATTILTRPRRLVDVEV